MTTNLDLFGEALNGYIVTPLNAFGFGGFLFDVEGETSVNLTAEITDHYLEDNSAVQDHIAIRPKKLTLKGYVGELVHRNEEEDGAIIQKVTQKLTVASQYLPTLSAATKQIQDAKREALEDGVSLEDVRLDSINRITDYYAFARNVLTPVSKQQQAYMYFKALHEGKFLVSVQTPFEFMNRMAIESVSAKQDEGSRFVSDFTIVLKEIRTVSVLNAEANDTQYTVTEASPEDIYQGRRQYQEEALRQVGNMDGLPEDDPVARWQAARDAQAEFLASGNPFE